MEETVIVQSQELQQLIQNKLAAAGLSETRSHRCRAFGLCRCQRDPLSRGCAGRLLRRADR